MKKFIYLFALSLVLNACTDNNQPVANIIEISENQSDYEYNADYVTFDKIPVYNQAKTKYLDSIKEQFIIDAEEIKEFIPEEDRNWKYELYITDSIFMASEEFISTRLTIYSFTGGNHGSTRFESYNFDTKTNKLLTNADILKLNDSILINKVLIKHFDNDGCFNLNPDVNIPFSLNISPEGLTFTFEHYELGPYACGYKEIFIPMKEAEEFIMLKTFKL